MPKKAGKGRTGRRKYEPSPQHLDIAYKGAKAGLNQREIAKAIGISYSTFRRHLSTFEQHVKKGYDEGFDPNLKKVKNALLQRCLGKSYVEKHTERRVDGAGKVIVTRKDITKKVQPSDVAIFFYLCNREKKNWTHAARIKEVPKPPTDEIEDPLDDLPTQVLEDINALIEKHRKAAGKGSKQPPPQKAD